MQRAFQQAQVGDYLLFLDRGTEEWYSGRVQKRLDFGVEVVSSDRRLSEQRGLNSNTLACIVPPDLLRGRLTVYGIAREFEESGLPLAAQIQLLERREVLKRNYAQKCR